MIALNEISFPCYPFRMSPPCEHILLQTLRTCIGALAARMSSMTEDVMRQAVLLTPILPCRLHRVAARSAKASACRCQIA